MTDLFQEAVSEADFSLPGDDEKIARMRGQAAPEVQPETPAVEAPAAETETPAEAPAETAPETEAPPPAVETETPAAAATDAPEIDLSDPRVQEYLARYGGDVTKALAAGADLSKVIGRQGQELGDLRKLVEQVDAKIEAPAQPTYDPNELAEWFEENPHQIQSVAQQAYYQGNEPLMHAALNAWEERDRAGARQFEQAVAVERAKQELRSEGQQAQSAADEWTNAAQTFAAAHPDVDQYATKMRELAPQYPHITSIIQNGSAEAKGEVLEFLYSKARDQAAGTLASSTREVAREQALEADKAIKDAHVVSAAAAVPAETVSVAEQIGKEWETADAPYSEGWNI